jgi:hypothetical protein
MKPPRVIGSRRTPEIGLIPGLRRRAARSPARLLARLLKRLVPKRVGDPRFREAEAGQPLWTGVNQTGCEAT